MEKINGENLWEKLMGKINGENLWGKLYMLYQLPGLAALAQLGLPSCPCLAGPAYLPLPSYLAQLPWPNCSGLGALAQQLRPSCSGLAALAQLTRPSYLGLAALAQLLRPSCHGHSGYLNISIYGKNLWGKFMGKINGEN